MPRKARSLTNASVLRISQSSSHAIFDSNDDRDAFLDMLDVTMRKFRIELFAYCLLQDHTFTLILRTPHLNISKAMASLLISYTHYKKPNGKLFNQRFKSDPIHTCSELQAIINTIKQPIQSQYHGYCFAHNSTMRLATVLDDTCFECEPGDLLRQLEDFVKTHDCSFEDILSNKKLREQCIVMLYQTTPCTLKEIGLVFNGLEPSTISKIITKSLALR